MWKSDKEWDELVEGWIGSEFSKIEVDDITKKSKYYEKIVSQCTAALPINNLLT